MLSQCFTADMRVDPDNRLVGDTLEADWNRKLGALQEAQQEYERQRQKDRWRSMKSCAPGCTRWLRIFLESTGSAARLR